MKKSAKIIALCLMLVMLVSTVAITASAQVNNTGTFDLSVDANSYAFSSGVYKTNGNGYATLTVSSCTEGKNSTYVKYYVCSSNTSNSSTYEVTGFKLWTTTGAVQMSYTKDAPQGKQYYLKCTSARRVITTTGSWTP